VSDAVLQKRKAPEDKEESKRPNKKKRGVIEAAHTVHAEPVKRMQRQCFMFMAGRRRSLRGVEENDL
jgi:hypothetical protein